MQYSLTTNKNYNKEATELANKISVMTKGRHAKWLVSLKYILDQSDVDSVLSRQSEFCDSVILEEKERITENQRLLLECESSKVKERRKAIEEKQKIHSFVVSDIAEHAYKVMSDKLSSLSVEKLFNRFPDFEYFIDTGYSPSLTYNKLSVLPINDSRLKSELLSLVNNPKFCARLGKSVREIQDPKTALGALGIDNSSLLFPILMAKPLLRWHDSATKNIAPKLWQHMILTANVTRIRLEQVGYSKPEQGIVLGVLRTISYFSIVNHFGQFHEDAIIQRMNFYRENSMRDEYYACADIKPDLSIVPKLISQLEKQLTQKVIDKINWGPASVHLRSAIQEDIDDVPVLERSQLGVALAQAQSYAIFDGLERSQVFVEKHKAFWFAHVQMSGEAIQSVRLKQPGRVALLS